MMAQAAYRSRFSKADAALIEALQERCGGELRKGTFFAKHDATDFELTFLPKQQGYTVAVPCRRAGRFRVTRKGALDRWMESFVPALEFRSRDSRFDRDFNVLTRDLELSAAVLTKAPNRAVVRRLFERGAQSVHIEGERVKVTCPRKSLGPKPAAEDVLGLVESLEVISAAVAAFAAHHELRPCPKYDPVLVSSFTTLGALGLAGFVMLLAGSLEYTLVRPAPFLLPCAILGLPAAVLVAFALALAVQRRTSPYGLVRGLAALSMLVVPLFVSGGLLLSNGLLDGTPAEEHVVTVVGKSARKNKDELRYRAGLASWWTDGDVRWVQVSQATFDQLVPQVSRMLVVTHPGQLGYEWLEGYSVVP
jgi:hypothetical protein